MLTESSEQPHEAVPILTPILQMRTQATERVSHFSKATKLSSCQTGTETLPSRSTVHALKHLVKNQSLHPKEKYRDQVLDLVCALRRGCTLPQVDFVQISLLTTPNLPLRLICAAAPCIPTEMPNMPLKFYVPPKTHHLPLSPLSIPILEPETWSFP